jgi:hypothetical protein
VSKKRYVDDIDDIDDSTYSLLGSKVAKLAADNHGKDRFRERRANDRQDHYAPSPKVKRARERL